MRSAKCAVCGRRVAISLAGGLRAHKTISAYERSMYPTKAERHAAKTSPWCIGGARQLALPL